MQKEQNADQTQQTKVEEKTSSENNPQDINWNQYQVYPEDDGTDRPRNPYSPV